MMISKVRDEFAAQVEVSFEFLNKNFAEALGYQKEQTLFLSKHENDDLFNLTNEHERLRTYSNDFRVAFVKDEFADKQCLEFTFYRREKRLHSDLTVEIVEGHLFCHTVFFEITKSDYDHSDTERVLWEFGAALALAAVEIIDEAFCFARHRK